MPRIDIPIKRMIMLRAQDWIKYLTLDDGEEEFDSFELETEIPVKSSSKLDSLIFCKSRDGKGSVLNIEPQGYLDDTLPVRMLRYCADIWEYTLAKKRGKPTIKQCVIFFHPEHDNKEHSLVNHWGDDGELLYSYRVIRVWEMDKNTVIENQLIGLYPLIPLMLSQKGQSSEELIELTVKTIETIEDEGTKSNVYAVFSILAGAKHSNDLIKKYVRREMLMKSTLFDEWVKEEREEAAKEAVKEVAKKTEITTTRQKTVDVLTERFDFVPRSIKEQLEEISDVDLLNQLHRKAVKVPTVDEFIECLNKAKQLV